MLLNLALASATAILLFLTFPRFDLTFLAPVALAPLVVASARERRPVRRFVVGWVSGIVYWAGSCYWIQNVLAVHGGMAGAESWAAFALFALYKGLHTGVFALLAGPAASTGWALLGVPALWVAIESTHGKFGFAWLMLGNAGIEMAIPMRLAPFTGVWGLSFVFAMTGVALAVVALRRPRWQLGWLLLLPPLFLLPKLPEAEAGVKTAALVQPNVDESAEWTPQWVEATHRRLASLSLAALRGEDDSLLVWPELPAPMYYYESAHFRDQIDSLARAAHAYLLLNVVPHDEQGAPLNSALLISPEGRPVGRYDKMNLVPFGEFVPWPFRSLVAKVSTEAGDFAAGRVQTTLPMGPHRIGAFVCYESVFPDFVRKFAADGAELLVNISNDGWYGRTAARHQHLKIARMRAAENRRWILRASNDGVTALIDPAGRVSVLLPSYTAGAANAGYSWISSTTFYSRHGDWFVWLCAAAALFALWRAHPWRMTRTSPSRTM